MMIHEEQKDKIEQSDTGNAAQTIKNRRDCEDGKHVNSEQAEPKNLALEAPQQCLTRLRSSPFRALEGGRHKQEVDYVIHLIS